MNLSETVTRERAKSRWTWKDAVFWRACPLLRRGGWPGGGRSEPAISDDNLTAALERVVACLRRGRIPYAIIGAWALAIWGKPRATMDLDFLVLVKEGLDHLIALTTRAGVEFDATWQEWNPLLRGSQARFQYRGVTIDVLCARDQHDREIIARRRRKRMGKKNYWVASPEDFILQKLKVGRPRDFEDALSVMERLGDELDRKYLGNWAQRLGVTAELDHIMEL
jgi:hypothetical protein